MKTTKAIIFDAFGTLIRYTTRTAPYGGLVDADGRPVIEEESEIGLLPNFAPPGTPAYESYQRLLDEHERTKAQTNDGG